MTRITRSGIALLLLLSATTALSAETEKDPANGHKQSFRKLFDGKSLKGWRGTKQNWKVQDGAIVGTTGKNGIRANTFLIAEEQFEDFVLRVKFKHDRHASGIQFRSRVLGKPEEFRVKGYQADIGGGDTGTFYEEQGRSTLAPANKAVVKKHYKKDAWNTYEIKAVGAKVELKLNGHVTARYEEQAKNIPRRGLIALQLQAGAPMSIWFKDIEILDLKKQPNKTK